MDNRLHDILGSLFGPGPAADDAAPSLIPLVELLDGLPVEVICLAEAPDRLLGVLHCATPPAAPPDGALIRMALDHLKGRDWGDLVDPIADRSALAVAIPCANTDGAVMVALAPAGTRWPLERVEAVLPRLRRVGALAATALRTQLALRSERERTSQLQREQAALRTSYVELVDQAIKEREARQREQEEYAAHLEHEVTIRAADLKIALARAEAANQAKTQFLTNISHELRTPLTAILGFADVAISESWGRPRTLEALAAVRRNGVHLLAIVDDLLDISMIEAGRLQVHPASCSPTAVLSEVFQGAQPRAAEKGLLLEVVQQDPWPQTITTDPQRLRQILMNLVGNAIKFTERGIVRMSAQHLRDPDRLAVQVQDTGIGIDPAHLDSLFQPFSQQDGSASRAYGGTGVGLCISRQLAQLLGGDLTVESVPGQGSRFTVTVSAEPVEFSAGAEVPVEPPANAQWPPPGRPSVPAGAGSIGRILLAEDMPDNRLLVTLLLRREHFEVTEAENGQIAVAKALAAEKEGKPFDLIVMDMQMPVMDGYAATRELRARGFRTPIFALTAHAMASDRERCLGAGCDEYHTKPLDPDRFLTALRRRVYGGASAGAAERPREVTA